MLLPSQQRYRQKAALFLKPNPLYEPYTLTHLVALPTAPRAHAAHTKMCLVHTACSPQLPSSSTNMWHSVHTPNTHTQCASLQHSPQHSGCVQQGACLPKRCACKPTHACTHMPWHPPAQQWLCAAMGLPGRTMPSPFQKPDMITASSSHARASCTNSQAARSAQVPVIAASP